MIKQIYNKTPLFLKVVLVNLIIFCFISLVYVIRFEENDDIVMLLLASGKYSGEFESHLVFINFIYAKLLNLLYYIYPGIEWYTLLFVLFNILSTSIIATLVIKSKNKQIIKIIFLVFLATLFLQMNIHLQFTKTSAMLMLSGLMLFYKGESTRSIIIAGILLILGSFVRFEVAGLILLIVFPLFVIKLFDKKKKIISKANVGLLLSVLLIVFFKQLDTNYYNSNVEWKNYKEYNKVRGKINDNPNSGKLKLFPEGVTENDYKSLHSFFIDPSVFTLDKLNKIVEMESVNNSINYLNIKKLFKNYTLWFTLLTLLFLVLLFSKIEYKPKIKMASLFISVIVILCFISLNGLVKYRVFISVIPVFILFIPLIVNFESHKKRISKGVVVILMSFILIITYKSFYILLCQKDDNINILKQTNIVSEYLKDKHKKVVIFGADYDMELSNAFTVSSSNSFSSQLYFNGWMTSAPVHNSSFNSFEDFNKDFAVFVSKKNSNKLIQLVKNNFRDHNNCEAEVKKVLETDEYEILEFNVQRILN